MDYEKMYQIYYMQVYSFTMNIVRDGDAAEEITQETFCRVIKSKGFRGESDISTYLCSIARNIAMDMYRRKKDTCEIKEESISEENIEKGLVNKEEALKIHIIIHDLKEPYKEVFQLRCFGELSYKEIAAVFGKSESWARVTYHRAKLMIREEMKNEEL